MSLRVVAENVVTDERTDTHTHEPSTVTLAAYACMYRHKRLPMQSILNDVHTKPHLVCVVGLRICTSKLKILRIKNREYRDGIKSRETRPGWGGTQCIQMACAGTTEGF